MKTSRYKIKIVCGFRKEQEFTIDANEAHKAYYLFNNPEKRGTFSNGLALRGSDIQRIEPDYNTMMGWNPTYQLTNDDWNEVHATGIMQKVQGIMSGAKEVARTCQLAELAMPLSELKDRFPLMNGEGSSYAKKLLANKKST
jgi:hypothetical protein